MYRRLYLVVYAVIAFLLPLNASHSALTPLAVGGVSTHGIFIDKPVRSMPVKASAGHEQAQVIDVFSSPETRRENRTFVPCYAGLASTPAGSHITSPIFTSTSSYTIASQFSASRSRLASNVTALQFSQQSSAIHRVNGNPDIPYPDPLDGSLVWLLIAIAAYGGKKLYYLSKNKDNSIE